MKNFFISDLHLDENHPKITDIFLKFLDEQLQPNDKLYILGDFFDTWIGDDDDSQYNTRIIEALRKTTQKGITIYLMHGNRDFLLGKQFQKATGCQFLPDEYVITLNNTPILLMHGDLFCTQDKKYLRFRRKSRNWLFQKIFLWRSLEKRRAIATHYRNMSRLHTDITADYIMDVTQLTVERYMHKHRVQHLIHGHTHRPAIHHFTLNGLPATRHVLAPWHENGSALVYDETGKNYMLAL